MCNSTSTAAHIGLRRSPSSELDCVWLCVIKHGLWLAMCHSPNSEQKSKSNQAHPTFCLTRNYLTHCQHTGNLSSTVISHDISNWVNSQPSQHVSRKPGPKQLPGNARLQVLYPTVKKQSCSTSPNRYLYPTAASYAANLALITPSWSLMPKILHFLTVLDQLQMWVTDVSFDLFKACMYNHLANSWEHLSLSKWYDLIKILNNAHHLQWQCSTNGCKRVVIDNGLFKSFAVWLLAIFHFSAIDQYLSPSICLEPSAIMG
jgi:hypothetical protein